MKAQAAIMFVALLALSLAPAVSSQSATTTIPPSCAQTGTCFTSYSTFQSWLPVVMLAILVSVTAVSAYYMFGVALNNTRIKSRAVSELGQSIGTGAIIVALLVIFSFVGTGLFSQVPAINQNQLQQICTQLGNSKVTMLNPNENFGGSTQIPTPTNIVCQAVQSPNSPDALTHSIDYGLFASYLIIANMTNQTLANLNSLYNFEGWMGFSYKFTSVTQVCSLEIEGLIFTCPSPPPSESIELKFSYNPLAGYEAIKNGVSQPVEVQATLTFYMFFLQLMVTMLILYLWPWLLAAGIILRSSFFTRRAGGLLIAIVIAWLLVFPMLYAMEYSAFNNPSGGLQPIGATNLPTLPLYTKTPTTTASPGVCYPSSSGYCSATQPSAYCEYTLTRACALEPGTQYSYQGYSDSACSVTSGTSSCGSLPSVSGTLGVYGVAKPQVGGDVPASTTSIECASGQYVPESVCGYNGTAQNACVDYSSATGQCSCQTGLNQAVPCTSLSIETASSANPPQQITVLPQGININFFVFPNVADVLRYYSCMPSNLPVDEVAFSIPYLSPLPYGLFAGVAGLGSFVSGPPANPSDSGLLGDPGFACGPSNAIHSALALANVYGIVGVTAYLVPLLNLIIIISAAVGMSGLMGGDTDIIGLSRLL